MLDKLLKNKSIQRAFMNQFKEIVEKENLKAIVITIDDKGELTPVLYKEDIKILSIDEYTKLINSLKSQL
jgi:hypothetical protein